MKFDITRAWKDENYRQTLSEEEMNTLPANPAGDLELSNEDMNVVVGGGGFSPAEVGGVGGAGVGGVGVAAPCCPPPVAVINHNNSVAVLCELNVNSLNIVNLAVLGAVTNICTNSN